MAAYTRATGRYSFTARKRPLRTANASRSLRLKAPTLRGTSFKPSPLSAGPSLTYKRYRIQSYRLRARPYLTPLLSRPNGGITCYHKGEPPEGIPLMPRFKARALETQPRPPATEGLYHPRVYIARSINILTTTTSSLTFATRAGSRIRTLKSILNRPSRKTKRPAILLNELNGSVEPYLRTPCR